MKVWPNAKVIITVREPEGWVKSVKSTLFKRRFLNPSIVFAMLGLFPTYLGDPRNPQREWPTKMFASGKEHNAKMREFGGALYSDRGVEFFNKWTDEVETNVPKHRLLMFNVKEGWAPVCKFLDVPIPDVPFPRVNSSKEFDDAHSLMYRRAWLLVYEVLTFLEVH